MGHVYVDAHIRATRAAQDVRFLVDTGSFYALLPQSVADAIGVLTLPDPVPVVLANAVDDAFPIGGTMIELLGRRAAIWALIAPDRPGLEPLLGVESLETLGFAVDPSSGGLRPTRARAIRLGRSQPR